jgi:CRP-like cAMP-binding protein
MDAPRTHWRPWLFLLTRNLLTMTCRENLMLTIRDTLLAPKRARDRIEAYLSQVYLEKKSLDFFIPFDQQQLADYLNLDRSVVSKELNKLKRSGILWFNRNHFILQPGTEITGGTEKK